MAREADLKYVPAYSDERRVHTTIGWAVDALQTKEDKDNFIKIIDNHLETRDEAEMA